MRLVPVVVVNFAVYTIPSLLVVLPFSTRLPSAVSTICSHLEPSALYMNRIRDARREYEFDLVTTVSVMSFEENDNVASTGLPSSTGFGPDSSMEHAEMANAAAAVRTVAPNVLIIPYMSVIITLSPFVLSCRFL